MKQFLLPKDLGVNESLELKGADFHYLHNVRRMRAGDRLHCRTPSGSILDCQISSIGGSGGLTLSVLAIVSEAEPELSQSPSMHLLMGMPKGKKLDQIIRQSVELGVSSIQILNCRNSVADLEERWDNKRQRYESIIKEALQQSGGSVIPELFVPCSVKQFVESKALEPGQLGLFLHEKELEQSSLHGYLGSNPNAVFIAVGPEGGFAEEEITILRNAGYFPVFLGSQVLRCETAAIVGLGAIKVIMKESPFWKIKDRNAI